MDDPFAFGDDSRFFGDNDESPHFFFPQAPSSIPPTVSTPQMRPSMPMMAPSARVPHTMFRADAPGRGAAAAATSPPPKPLRIVLLVLLVICILVTAFYFFWWRSGKRGKVDDNDDNDAADSPDQPHVRDSSMTNRASDDATSTSSSLSPTNTVVLSGPEDQQFTLLSEE